MVAAIRRVPVAARVEVQWVYEERPRVVGLKVLAD